MLKTVTPNHTITLLLLQTTSIAHANLVLSIPQWNKNKEWERQTLFVLKISRLTIGLGTLLVSSLLVSSPHHFCDPSLSPQITAPSACRKCLGVFTGKNEGSTKIFSISTGTNFTLHSCSESAVPQRPSRIWLRYMETWLIFYEHSFLWYIFKGTAYISIMWKKWRQLFWQK